MPPILAIRNIVRSVSVSPYCHLASLLPLVLSVPGTSMRLAHQTSGGETWSDPHADAAAHNVNSTWCGREWIVPCPWEWKYTSTSLTCFFDQVDRAVRLLQGSFLGGSAKGLPGGGQVRARSVIKREIPCMSFTKEKKPESSDVAQKWN